MSVPQAPTGLNPLEHLAVNKLVKACNLSNCLDLYFFVATFCDVDVHTCIFKKVNMKMTHSGPQMINSELQVAIMAKDDQ